MISTTLVGQMQPLLAAFTFPGSLLRIALVIFIILVALWVLKHALGMRYIPHDRVGVVEKLWSLEGALTEGRLIAAHGEAGYQADLLRGGLHFFFWAWQYRIHKLPLVTIPQGKIGYVYARDGEPLEPMQTLGRVVPCNNFQDCRAFLGEGVARTEEGSIQERGQRGRQRAIIREGVYAVNLAQFVVIAEQAVYAYALQSDHDMQTILNWQAELGDVHGFSPVVIGAPIKAPDPIDPSIDISVDSIGIVTVHDGPSLPHGEIIAPPVGQDPNGEHYHNNYQNTEAFLAAGGMRGRQYPPLTDGTYFINRWFATVEMIPKTVVPIGYVGVVVSYYGKAGVDVSGDSFRHGELVTEGERGVWQRPLGPGKYAFNTYAGRMSFVPTTNFVLHWITGRSETHRYDESLRSIDLVTMDAYEPVLPLSVVVHIDYQKAPSVVQRFGDVKKLITQTLDPLLSAFFRDVAHKKTMLELLQERDEIQGEARAQLRGRFLDFDIECVDVLIGKPDTAAEEGKIEVLLEQLRQRQLSREQIETYERKRAAAEKLQVLNEAEAHAQMQTELTNSQVQIKITENKGEAEVVRSRKQADQTVITAQARARQTVLAAEAESKQRILAGQGESKRVLNVGMSEAAVLLKKIAAFSDPRLYALSVVSEVLSQSKQPLVPERLFVSAQQGEAAGQPVSHGLLGLLISLLAAEKSGFEFTDSDQLTTLRDFAERAAKEVEQSALSPDSPAEGQTQEKSEGP